MGPKISKAEFEGTEQLLTACGKAGFSLSWTTYVLATAFWETKGTMQPVVEAFWMSESARNAYYKRMYDIKGARPKVARHLGNLTPGDGIKYCGRGYPQVTGKANYVRLGKALNIDLENNPDLMLRADVASAATVYAMRTGLFTGKKLGDFLPSNNGLATHTMYEASRPIVNGTDKDDEIADIALIFQEAMSPPVGDWRQTA